MMDKGVAYSIVQVDSQGQPGRPAGFEDADPVIGDLRILQVFAERVNGAIIGGEDRRAIQQVMDKLAVSAFGQVDETPPTSRDCRVSETVPRPFEVDAADAAAHIAKVVDETVIYGVVTADDGHSTARAIGDRRIPDGEVVASQVGTVDAGLENNNATDSPCLLYTSRCV